ncbi:TPA: molecular chaperone [Vibrio cholerae]|nr:molecular chaperone [Vibrio cholerae]
MNVSIYDSLLKRESILNHPSLSLSSVSTSDIDATENGLDSLSEDSDLIFVLEKQREAVKAVSPRNTETDISNALLDSIDKAALELELLNAWTEGGVNVIAPMLDMMLSSIISDGEIEGTEIEDLIQIMLIDLMVNGKSDSLDENEIAWLTEFIGSGAHKDRVAGTNITQAMLAEAMTKVYYLSINDSNSIASKAANELFELYGEDVEEKINEVMQSEVYWTDDNGFYLGNDGYSSIDEMGDENCHRLSPILRLVILSMSASNNNNLSPEDWSLILTSSPKKIEEIINDNLFDFIIINGGSDKWHIFNPSTSGDGGAHFGQNKYWLDYIGTGIDKSYLDSLFKNFPSRVLTDDELKKVNRIGDNVKMIMQTLKYWFQILRDERVAVARNI